VIVSIDKTVPPYDSYAAERTRGLYNVDVEDGSRFRLDVDVPVERTDWQIGVVVGPSGSGKTSIANALRDHDWHEWVGQWLGPDFPIIEVLGSEDYAKATAALAAVGLGSVPSWLRPYDVLSNGERFRADMAQLLMATADSGQPGAEAENYYIDEFTSVLDRQVAKVGAGAFAKAWRRQPNRRVILITPHYDVLDWVQPDWWIDTAEGLDEFAHDRGVVQARKGSFQEAHDRARYPGDRVATLEC
jgi:hypothetical protein